MISTDNIVFCRQGKTILDHVSLTVKRNDFISLIGPNGAGKTTLLKILLGIIPADSGTVIQEPGLRVSYMPQKIQVDSLFPMTIKRFLTLALKTSNNNLTKVINEVGIAEILNKPMSSASGGELQRVLLTRALLSNPDLLILDEPVQNLDVQGQVYFYELLEKLYGDRHLTILMVSHDLYMVMRATRKVICLYHHICCEGKPEMVSQHPRFVELFGHDTGHMLKVYQHSHNHSHDIPSP